MRRQKRSDARRANRQAKRRTAHLTPAPRPQSAPKTVWDGAPEEVKDLLRKQVAFFRERFGRSPTNADPLFFRLDSTSTPEPIPDTGNDIEAIACKHGADPVTVAFFVRGSARVD